MKYKTRPIIVEAVQWTGANLSVIEKFAGGAFIAVDTRNNVFVHDAEGPCATPTGYWLLRQFGMPLRVFSPAAFEATFTPFPPAVAGD